MVPEHDTILNIKSRTTSTRAINQKKINLLAKKGVKNISKVGTTKKAMATILDIREHLSPMHKQFSATNGYTNAS